LELAPHGCVRQFVAEHQQEELPLPTRGQTALDVASAVSYIHFKGMQHSGSLFLFDRFLVKLATLVRRFSKAADSSRYELRRRGREFKDRRPIKREIFALASSIYEIMAWRRPFQGLADEMVESRYGREEFPSLEGNVAGLKRSSEASRLTAL